MAEAADAPLAARGFTVRALGEVAIRCADVERMAKFYGEVIGLTPFARRPFGEGREIVFFSLGESHGGHTAVLALFPQDASLSAHDGTGRRAGPLHHFALTVDAAEQAHVVNWYERLGQTYTIHDFAWVGWRGVFTRDPEGNTVELVAYVGGSKTGVAA